MNEFMTEDSSIGIVNLDKVDEDDEEVQTESYAMQLKAACENMASDLANSVATMRGEEAPADAAAPGASPFGKDGKDPAGNPFGGN
jgi:alanine racemase